MEAASGVAGLISLADLVISRTIKYSLAVKGSTTSINIFLSEIQSLWGTLKAIERTSEIYKEVYKDNNLIPKSSAEAHIKECNHLLEQIRTVLKATDLQDGSFKKRRRQLLWPFESAKTKELVDSLERQKQSLNLAFNRENWLASIEANKNQSADIRALNETIKSKHTSEEHRRIFKWLGDVDHTTLQQNGIAQRSNLKRQTGKWFIEGDQFTHWLETKGAKLWVHGIPGAGKTVLASTIIDEVQDRTRQSQNEDTDRDILVYFYCDFRHEKTTIAWNIMGSLVKQVAQQNRQCLHLLEDFYLRYNPTGQAPKPCDPEKLSQFLQEMAQDLGGNVLVVIDGLDEIEKLRIEAVELLQGLCSNSIQEYAGTTSLLQERDSSTPDDPSSEAPADTISESNMNTVDSMSKSQSVEQSLSRTSSTTTLKAAENGAQLSTSSFKLLFLSRSLHDIEVHLDGFEQQIIEAELDDLRLYVASELDFRVSNRRLKFANPSLKEDILDRLVHESHGMFQWVACQIDFICSKTNDRMKRAALDQLPKDLPQTYDRILRGVDENHVALVRQTLEWIIYAAQPLPVSALLQALAVTPEDEDYDETAMTDEDVLLQCCSSLVKKTQSSGGYLELAHFSVKQYLLSITNKSPPEIAQYRIGQMESRISLAQTCLTFLNFKFFEKGPRKTLKEFHELALERPFLMHASKFWHFYAAENFSKQEIMALVKRLFNPRITGQFRLWNQCILAAENLSGIENEGEKYKACMEASPLHWATILALPEVSKYLLEDFPPNLESGLGKPIHCALTGIGLLQEFSLTMEDFYKYMTRSDFQTFLDPTYTTGPGIDVQPLVKMENDEFQEFLQSCSSSMQQKTMRQLLDRKAVAYSAISDNTGLRNDISSQISMRHQTVKILIDSGADLNIELDKSGLDPLGLALLVTSKDYDFLSLLLDAGAKVSTRTFHLAWLLFSNQTDLVKPGLEALVRYKLPMDTSLSKSDQALFLKMTEDMKGIENEPTTPVAAQTLQATMSAADKISFKKSLMTNVRQGVTLKVKLRLEQLRGSSLADEFSSQVEEAFYLAVKKGWREIVPSFLKYGVSIDQRAFSRAVQSSDSRLVDILLDHDPNIACQKDLYTAIERADYDIFSSLLKVGMDTSSVDEKNNLPIHKALTNDPLRGSPSRELIIKDLVDREPLLNVANSEGELPIHLAAWLGLEKVVENFLERVSPFETECNTGYRPSHYACFKDSETVLELLIAHNADVNARRREVGGGPLHYAASFNAPRCTQVLINAKADIEQLSASQYTPLVLASLKNSWKTVEILMKAGANINAKDPETNSTVLHCACAAGMDDIVALVLEQQPDIEAQTLEEQNPLFLAATNGHIEIVDRLLRQNAQVDAGREARSTPLHRAISGGFPDVVKLLLDYGPKLECLNSAFQTPLTLAMISEEFEIAEMLVRKGANVNVQDIESDRTPFLLAAKTGLVNIVKVMINHGANVNQISERKEYTALIMASCAHGESLATIKLLIENGADVHARAGDTQKSTALIWAINHQCVDDEINAEIVEYLLDHGANACETRTSDGMTALMSAIMSKNTRIVRALLARGAQINAQVEKSRETAISLAVSTNQPEMCKILLDKGANLSLIDDYERSIAHTIARAANIEILKYFLAHDTDWESSGSAKFLDLEHKTQIGISPLHLACKYGFADFITCLWDRQILNDVEISCGDDIRPLHWGAAGGHKAVVEVLLAKGADANAATLLNGCTPLQLAAGNGHSGVVALLIKGGALVNIRDKCGRTAADLTSDPTISQILKSAFKKQETEVNEEQQPISPEVESMAIMPSFSSDRRFPELKKACEEGQINNCRQLLFLGVDCNGMVGDGCSLLQTAFSKGNEDIISLFIDNGADIHYHAGPKVGRHGYQAIHYAVWGDLPKTVQKLLDKGARMSDFGVEPIHIAAFQGRTAVLRKLLEFECNQSDGSAQRMLNVQIRKQEKYPKMCLAQDTYTIGSLSTGTALHLAAYNGKLEAMSVLIDYGADIDAVDGIGQTPLHCAIAGNSLPAVKLILDAGAKISMCNPIGDSSFVQAVGTGYLDIIEELISRSEDVMTVNVLGRGAIHYAIRENHTKVLEQLCGLGLSFDLCDIYGQTPFELAINSEFPTSDEVISFLIDHTSLFLSDNNKTGNLLNLLCSISSDIISYIKRIVERVSKEESPEILHSYVNNVSELFGSPLYSMSFRGNVEAMDILFKVGANVATASGPHGTALNAACAMGRVDAIKWLLRNETFPVTEKTMQLASSHILATRVLNRYKELGLDGLLEQPILVLPMRSAAAKTSEETDAELDRPSSSASQRVGAKVDVTMADGERPGSSAGQQDTATSGSVSLAMTAEDSASQPFDKTQSEFVATTSEPIQPETPTKSSSNIVTPNTGRFQQDIGVATLSRPHHLQLPSLTSSSPINRLLTFASIQDSDSEQIASCVELDLGSVA